MASIVPGAAYITPYDFSKLVECESINDINREFVDGLLSVRNSQVPSVNERNIGFDVWSKMLVQAGILKRNTDRSLSIANQGLVDWILSSYKKSLTDNPGKINSGILRYLPVITPSETNNGKAQSFFIESKALQASLFDSVDRFIIDKFIMNSRDCSFADMEDALGIKGTKGFYGSFVGLEHLIGYFLMTDHNPSVRTIGEILSNVEMCNEEPIDAESMTPDWFREQAEGLITIDQEADALYNEFQKYFAPDILKQMAGRDMLDKLFYSDHRAEHNLCHTLEHDTRFQLFGGIKGGSSYKFGLFYSKEQGSWITGSPKKVIKLTEEEAITLGSSIRDELVAGAETIANYGELKDLNDYADLYARVFKVMPTLINKMWAMKYLHMIFPNVFPVFYSEEWQDSVLNKLNIEPKENSFIRMGQIALFVKKCGISNVAFSKIFYQIKNDTSIDQNDSECTPDYKYDFSSVVEGAQNLVVYGTPGCGKSFYVEHGYLRALGVLRAIA